MQLTSEQESIFGAIDRGENIFVTGVAGTGKSFLINEIARRYGADLTATTGIAALNIGGTTIHSWSGMGIGNMLADGIAGKVLYQRWMEPVRNKILKSKLLVIDEISMLSDRMLDLLDEVLRIVIYKGNGGLGVKSDKPFGGLQVVLVGDFLQLPPVVKENSQEDFCFNSRVWREANIQTHMLTHVFRQEAVEFADCLRNVRLGRLTERDVELLTAREGIRPDGIFPVCIYPVNKQADLLNQGQLNQIEGHPTIFEATELLDHNNILKNNLSEKSVEFHRERLDRDCLAPKNLHLKIGAQVMLLKNLSFERGLVNGSMGKIVGFVNETYDCEDVVQDKEDVLHYGAPVVEFFNGVTQVMDRAKWESKEGEDVIITRVQYPLRLAWAITAHKAQGMTLDFVYCDLAKIFEYGQAYVALSRAKNLQGLYLNGFSPTKVRANPKALRFYEDMIHV